MKVLRTLGLRVRQFGLRRSVAVYLVIVVGLVLASEFAIEQIVGQGDQNPGSAILNALAIAALVGVFVFFLFQGAVEDREQASVALANSEERFRSLTSLSADWFWETDPGHRISWIAGGHSMLKLFGSELAYGRRIWEIPGIVVPEAAIAAHLKALHAQGPFHEFELCRPGRDGQAEYHLISGEPRLDRTGRFLGYRGVGRDVTGSKRAEAALSGAKERLELALNSGALAIWDSDLSTGRIFVSEGWAQILGEPACNQSLRVDDVLERVHPLDREAGLMASRRALKGETVSFVAEIRLRLPSGDWKWAVASGQVVERDAGGRVVRMTGTIVDIDGRKRAEHALRDAEARYRTLVDLSPDGVLLQSDGRIEYANRAAADILGTPRPASLVGLASMELIHPDDYPKILERALYLRGGPGKADFSERRMLRLDGGVVTVEGASVSYLERGRLVVQTVLRDISERVKAREELAEREQRFRDVVEAAGEYVWETDHEFSELLKNADAARYAAREADGNTYWFFSRELNTRALERLDMESALHRALARDEFVLHFQPVVHSAGATRPRLIGAEVLMRWRHPERGMLALGEFFPFAEQAGLMGALGGWLVERATGHIAAWGQGPAGGLWFALNVSAKELSRDRRFSDTLRGALHRNRLDGSRLALEISERSMQTGWDACTEALNAVAALGVALTIDDFGAGQSSLAALREMPVRKLKIDRSLVADLVAREDAGVIVQTVAAMAKGLGLSVAAEGVETEAQLARLRAAGCDEWQGRLYSEPLDADAFEALVSGVSRAASA